MGYRTITITDEVYNQLKEVKRERESFSEEITRLTSGKKSSIMDLAGSWEMSDKEKARIEKKIKEVWGTWDVRLPRQ